MTEQAEARGPSDPANDEPATATTKDPMQAVPADTQEASTHDASMCVANGAPQAAPEDAAKGASSKPLERLFDDEMPAVTDDAPKKDPPDSATDGASSKPLEHLFDDEMEVDDSPLDRETYQLLAQYDDPWADLKDPHVMMNFYRKLFPWKQLFLWLNQDHTPSQLFTHREFAVTLQNDAYLRYNSYASYQDLQKDIIRLNPTRFEIGPAYSGAPRDRKTIAKAAFKPVMRELVFDIDLTDYDDVRGCCSEKQICGKCWKFIVLAVKVLHRTLTEDFGFKHLLWVYSGRRGIHCWVSDPLAMRLSDDQRKAIVGYIDLMRGGGSKSGLKVDARLPLHPMVQSSFDILKVEFEQIALIDQDVFKNEANYKILLRACDLPMSTQSKVSKMEDLKSMLLLSRKPKAAQEEIKHNLILHFTYPRIDLEVSKHLNHLLKSPFCVHPATGKVCVPIDPDKVDEFEPEKVPDVRELLRELDRQSKDAQNPADDLRLPSAQLNWNHTALKPYVALFENHVNGLLKDRIQSKKELKSNSMDF